MLVNPDGRLALPATATERKRLGLPDIPFAEIGLYRDQFRSNPNRGDRQ
jgi:hypothetical protein